MNYLEHTTILKANNKEYKLVRLQKYNSTSHKATNKYYVDGKMVNNFDRVSCERAIDEAHISTLVETQRNWEK